jgi:hypothetical protein
MRSIFISLFSLFFLLAATYLYSEVHFSREPFVSLSPDEIEDKMNERFLLRDTFKEKGNAGKYLKVSHMIKESL